MRRAIRDYLAAAPPELKSVNPTHYTALLERPIGVTIEVTRGGGDFDKAEVQCAVWVAAQFNRLERLVAGVREAQLLERHEVVLQQQEDDRPSPSPPSTQSLFSQRLPQRIGNMSLDTSTLACDASATMPATTTTAPSSVTGFSTHGTNHGQASTPTMIPFLPIIIAHGHMWHFHAATRSATGTTVSCYLEVLLLYLQSRHSVLHLFRCKQACQNSSLPFFSPRR
jgi:hypothetical protein